MPYLFQPCLIVQCPTRFLSRKSGGCNKLTIQMAG
uniref:Uncharacterized protein n=1 Tax=Manihot esculenta TaxID=3983 RepID=A0A2C9V6Y2_MANES